MVTPSRQLYLDACQRLADRLTPLGFRYRRSRTDLTLRREEWTCEIVLQSSRFNSVDDVSVSINPSLSSSRVSDYRKVQNETYTFGSVIGGFLEYWAPYDPPFFRNLAGPRGAAVLDENVDRIRTGPLAVLGLLRQPRHFAESATDLMLVHAEPGHWIDYLAAYDERRQIPELLRRYAGDLHWNDGSLVDRRRVLVDAQRLVRGLPAITDLHRRTAPALVKSLNRAGSLDDLLALSL